MCSQISRGDVVQISRGDVVEFVVCAQVYVNSCVLLARAWNETLPILL